MTDPNHLKELQAAIEADRSYAGGLLRASNIQNLQAAVLLLIEDRLSRLRRVHRDAKSGRFITEEQAASSPSTTVTEKR